MTESAARRPELSDAWAPRAKWIAPERRVILRWRSRSLESAARQCAELLANAEHWTTHGYRPVRAIAQKAHGSSYTASLVLQGQRGAELYTEDTWRDALAHALVSFAP